MPDPTSPAEGTAPAALVDKLVGQGADILAMALDGTGSRVVSCRVLGVDSGARCARVSYLAELDSPGSGRQSVVFGASCSVSRPAPSAGVHDLHDGQHFVQVWRPPFDPQLPGMRALLPDNLQELVLATGAPAQPLTVTEHVYRPHQRAVVEVHGPSTHLFLKVLRPTRIDALDRRHKLLLRAGLPVPQVRAMRSDGVLAFRALGGVNARSTFFSGDQLPPTGEQLLDLLDQLPETLLDLPAKPSWSQNHAMYADLLTDALPHYGTLVTNLARRLERALPADLPPEPVHGDFHAGQLLMDGSISGLLDLDDAGPGRRSDDLGCALAHLEVLTGTDPHNDRLNDTLVNWRSAFSSAVDPRELHVRTAGVALALATGPCRTREVGWQRMVTERLSLVGMHLDAARR